MEHVRTMLESLIFSKITKKNSKKFCFMNVIIGYISIVLYSDSSWSDTAISPEASFHMTPGKVIRTSKIYKIVLFERRSPLKYRLKYVIVEIEHFVRKFHEIRYVKAHRSRG